MATITRTALIALTREYMDAVAAERWSDAVIQSELADTFDSEWSSILSAAPYYRFSQRSVTTDSSGQITLSGLNGSTGDTTERWFRILHVTDGSTSFPETEFAKMPLATSSSTQSATGKAYYLRGELMQVLPVTSGLALTVSVNWMPQGIADLAAGTSVVDFPENAHSILAKEAASQLLMKGGAELSAAQAWSKSAEKSRAAMLDQIRRRTMNATLIGYPDNQLEWAGG